MEMSLKATEMLMPPQTDEASSLEAESSEVHETAASSSSVTFDPMLEFNQRLEDIFRTHGPAGSVLNKLPADAEMELMESRGDPVVMETGASLRQSLNNPSSPEEKLEEVNGKHSVLAAPRRSDEQQLSLLQQKFSILMEEHQQLQAEHRSSIAARSALEGLCRDLQAHYSAMREETLQRCREDEEKRKDITSHFQEMLTEIQAQIEQHSARNDNLCRENANLTEKLESLMTQYERREESLEKINKHRDLQHKLTEAKLQQANALLAEAEDKHKREKEYLLREAIDKTKKCFAMKEQELAMKKKLTLYGQKFDEFQETLAKSNEIYVRFKKEMDKMTEKMKKVEKESNLWKTRFENCNKALTDMIQERTEKAGEYDLFVLKIQKLEKLCRVLQEERKILYQKIKEVRHSNTNLPSKMSSLTGNSDPCDHPPLLDAEEIQELQEEDPVLTENIVRLKEEQAKLQEFAASLLATPDDVEENEQKEESELEEDMMVSAFVQFKTKPQVQEVLLPVSHQVEDPKSAESDFPKAVKEELRNPSEASTGTTAPSPEGPTPEGTSSETIKTSPEVREVLTQGQVEEVKQARAEEDLQKPVGLTPETNRTMSEPELEAPKPKIQEVTGEVKPVLPVEEEKAQQQQVSGPSQEPEESTQPSEDKPAASSSEDSTKQLPKKKKKKSSRSVN
ncbi:beta-taxilin isoform X1 [Nothobranchius furzeri]|uniref:beta-taxilin isoform X1 n=1 Tax=Nothobranchius furzeri TaxID=105023 RepID=UPI00077D4A66